MAGGLTAMPHQEEKVNGFDKFEVESWLRSLKTAKEVEADPKKLEAVQKLAKEEIGPLKSIAALRKRASKRLDELGGRS